MLIWLVLATRIVASPVSNVFQKHLARRSADPLLVIAATHGMLAAVCLPLLPGAVRAAGGATFWTSMVVAGVLAVAGNVLLVYALKWTDLSVLGPVNAYKAVLSLALAVVLLGEIPTPVGLLGVLLIVAGSYFVVDRDAGQPRRHAFVLFFRDRGVRFRLAALGFSATEAVFLKKALLLSTPLSAFVLWSVLGLPIAALALAVLPGRWPGRAVSVVRGNWSAFAWLGITTGLMQMATLLTFGQLQVAYSLALFQLSTLISVFLGHRVFREVNIRERLVGSLIMVGGAVLIMVFGSAG